MNTDPKIQNNIEALIIEAEPETVAKWLADGDALLIDVRETSEYEQEHIPGSMLVPLSALDPDSFPRITIKKLVLHCAIGKRSAAAAKQLIQAGHTPPINMKGGLKAWREAGLDTEIYDAPPAPPVRAPKQDELKPSDRPPGSILKDEFLAPHAIATAELAYDLGLPAGHVLAMIDGDRPLDADMAFRLARYFSTTEEFWLRLQMAYDLDRTRERSADEIQRTITPRKDKPAAKKPDEVGNSVA